MIVSDLADTGRWAGPLPADWRVAKLRHVTSLYAGGTPDKGNARYWEGGTVPWLNSGAVNNWLITEPSAHISEEGFRNSSARWIPRDSLVIALAGQGRTKGMVARLAAPMTCNQSMAAIVPSRRMDSGYLHWWLHANYLAIRHLAGGDLRDGLNLDLVGGIPVPAPHPDRQRAIARYLDTETERIDALIAKKREQLGLLGMAVASRVEEAMEAAAVSQVPLRRLLAEPPQYGAGESGEAETPDWPRYIRITDLEADGTLRPDDIRCLQPGTAQPYLLESGDVLVARSGATVGKAFIYRAEMGAAAFAGYLIRLRFNPSRLHPAIFKHWTQTRGYWDQIAAAAVQATIQNVSAEKYKDLLVPLPPTPEQEALLATFDAIAGTASKARDALASQLSLLVEHRQALIKAAVTGELAVPGMAAA